MEKLAEMKRKIDALLADPDLYHDPDPLKFEKLQIKRAEIEAGLERAEALWIAAAEKLESAEAQ
jgi:ATP-binding cassette subfamily F protein 3